jgi:hypothetical protein
MTVCNRPRRPTRLFSMRLVPLHLVKAALLAVALALPAAAQAPDPDAGFNKGGRTAFQFVKIGVGARQAALGEASIASVRDVSSAFWNPAGIMGIERYEATFSYTRWLADMNYVAAAVGGRVPRIGTFAVMLAALDYGDLVEAVMDDRPDGRTGQMFSGGDILVGVAYARQFTDRLTLGVGAKYLHETLWDRSAGAFAFDVGTTYDIGYRGLTLAMAAQNYAEGIRFGSEEEGFEEAFDIPLLFRVGLSGTLAGPDGFIGLPGANQVTASVEALNSNDYGERLHFGLEYVFSDLLALRGGYRLNYAEGNWSVGAGVTPPPMGGARVRLDYAYVGYEFLTAPHRFSVALAF